MRTKPRSNLRTNQRFAKQMHALSVVVSRAQLGQRLGQSFGGDRKLYTVCGYPLSITYGDYDGHYKRQDVAKRIINAFPDATWRGIPEVFENEDKEKEPTKFEKAWKDLLDNINLYHYFCRADKLAGVGRYAVLLLGFDDEGDWKKEVSNASELLYMMPYSEGKATIKTKVTDKNDKRFGLPLTYEITTSDEPSTTTSRTGGSASTISAKLSNKGSIEVHWSRVLHIAHGCLESDVYGTPDLEACYNRLQDLEQLLGGSAQMFWNGGFPGLNLNIDADATPPDESDLEDEIEAYINGLTRTLKTQNIDVKTLASNIANPEFHVKVQMMMLSAATGIPMRILTGSERGELASGQDENNWNQRVDERRHDFAEPMVLRQFVDRMIEVGVLPEPKDGYMTEWPDIDALSEEDQAKIGKTRSETLKNYVTSPGADEIIPPMQFLTEIMGLSLEKAEAMLEEATKLIDEEERDAEEAARNAPPEEPEEEDEE